MKTKLFKSIATGLLSILVSASSIGQEVTSQIGSGTSTTGNLPIYGYYGYTYSQQIYLASEFDVAMQGQPSLITKIRFYNTSGSLNNANSWTVFMGTTSNTSFASSNAWIPNASLSQVFSGTLTSPAANTWMEITLDSPFLWNGIDNIVVAVDENTSGYSTINWRSFPSGATRGIYAYSDGTNPNPASPPTTSAYPTYLASTSSIAQAQFIHEPATACSGSPTHTSAQASIASFCVDNAQDVDFNLSNLDFVSGYTFVWQYNDAGTWTDFTTSTNTSSFSTLITETTEVRAIVTCSNSGGIDISDPVTVTVNALPTVEVDVTEATFCDGNSVIVNASGADTYVWSPTTGLDNSNTPNVLANPTSNTTYTVTGTDANGCANTATSNISPISDVEVTMSVNPTEICAAGSPVTLTAEAQDATGTYEYRFLEEDGITEVQTWGATGDFTFTPANAGDYTYFYQARHTTCPDYIDSIAVSITVGFGADVTTIAYDCTNLGGTLTIENDFGQAEGGVIYANPLNASSSELTFHGVASIANGMAQITPSQTSAAGGMTIDIPNFSTGANNSFTVSFDLTMDQPINTWGTGGADGLAYSFGDNANYTAAVAHNGKGNKLRLVFDAADNSPNATGIYLVYGYNGTTNIPVNDPSVLAYSNNTALWKLLTSVPVELSINSNGLADLMVNGVLVFDDVQMPAAYMNADISTWKHLFSAATGGDALRQAISNIEFSGESMKYAIGESGVTPVYGDNKTATGLQPGLYDVWISKDGVGSCEGFIGTFEIENANPQVELGNDTTICAGSSLTLDAGNTGSTYVWSNSANVNQTYNVSQSGNYVVYVTDANNCVGIGSIEVEVIDAPTANGIFVQGAFPTVSLGVVSPENATTYDWDFGDGNGATNAPSSLSHTYWSEGTYTVTVTMTNACGSTELTQTVNATASITNHEIEGLEVYPNPASNQVTIVLPEGTEAQTLIYTIDGSIVYEDLNFNGKNSINVVDWKRGVYFIHITSNEKSAVVKLVVS